MMADLRRLALGLLLLVIATAMPYHYAVVATLLVGLALIALGIGTAGWSAFRWLEGRRK